MELQPAMQTVEEVQLPNTYGNNIYCGTFSLRGTKYLYLYCTVVLE